MKAVVTGLHTMRQIVSVGELMTELNKRATISYQTSNARLRMPLGFTRWFGVRRMSDSLRLFLLGNVLCWLCKDHPEFERSIH